MCRGRSPGLSSEQIRGDIAQHLVPGAAERTLLLGRVVGPQAGRKEDRFLGRTVGWPGSTQHLPLAPFRCWLWAAAPLSAGSSWPSIVWPRDRECDPSHLLSCLESLTVCTKGLYRSLRHTTMLFISLEWRREGVRGGENEARDRQAPPGHPSLS